MWINTSDSRSSDKGAWGQTIWYNPTTRGWLKDGVYTMDSSLDDKMYFAQFSDWMPDLNLANPDVIDYIKEVAEFWLNDVGVKGFRMDATSHLFAHNERTDIVNRNQANVDVLKDIHDYILTVNPDAYVVIEAWEGYDVYTKYFEAGLSVFNFQGNYWIKDAANGYLTDDIGSRLQLLYDEIRQHQDPFLDSIFISNHDMDRAAKTLGDPDQVRLAAEILLTVQGNPFIYYGDEVGMLGYRNNMIWGDYYESLFAQFDEKDLDKVDEQLADPDSLLNSYIALGNVRNNSLALSYGEFIPYESQYAEGYYRIFENGNDKELVIVLFNFSSIQTIPIPSEFTSYEILYSSYDNNFGGISPKGTMILRLPFDLKDDLIN